MDVRMPDGTVITGVPEGITQTELLARYNKYSTPAPAAAPAQPPQPEAGLASIAPKPVEGFGESKPVEGFGKSEPIDVGPVKQPFTPEQQKEASFLEELKKGATGAFEYGLPSMYQQTKLQGSADAFIAKQKSLDLMNKIDSGEFKNLNELKNDPTYLGLVESGQNVSQLNAYMANKGQPEVAAKLRGKVQKDFNEMGASADTSIDLLNKYTRENQEKYGPRVQNFTDINWTNPQVAADFANWMGHSMGSAGVQLAPIVLAGVITKQPGVFTLGSAMETAGAVQNRMEAIGKKTKDMSPAEQKQEIKKYLAETGDANLIIGAASGSFDMLLGPAAHAARTSAKELMKAGAIKKAIGELPKDMLEEAGTGALQEATQIAGKKILEEAPKQITGQDVKDIVNSAMAEAMGAPAGTAVNVGRAAVLAPSEKKPEVEEEKREPYVKQDINEAEALARSKGFLTPQAPKTTQELVKETVPTSESQDYEAMIAELEAQMEGKPAPAKAEEPAVEKPPVAEEPAVKESLTTEEPVKEEPKADLITEAQKYDTPDLRLKQSDVFGTDVTTALYDETESHGRAAARNRGLTEGYAKKKDELANAADAAIVAFGTGDFSVFEPYAKTFPKLAKKLESHLSTETKAEPVVEEAKKEEPTVSKELQDAKDALSKAGQRMNTARRMRRDSEITEEQFKSLQNQFDARKKVYDDLMEKEVGSKSPFYKEAMEIGNRMIATGDVRAAGFGQGIIARARLGQIDEESMSFYRERAKEYEQRSPEFAGKTTITEKRGLPEFVATGNKQEIARYEYLKDHPEHKDVLAKASDALQAVADEANRAGFKVDDINPTSPQNIQEIKRKASRLAGATSRYMMEAERVAKGHKTADQAKLDKARAGLEADIQSALTPTEKAAAPAAKEKPKTGLDKVAHWRRQSWDKNPLMAFLANHGLYHEKGKPGSLMSEFNAGQQIMISGYGPVFKASGLQVDALLPLAIQDGFLPQDANEDDLSRMIEKAISGKKVEALYQEQGVEDVAAKYEEGMAKQEAGYEERAEQTDAEWYGMTEQEYADMMAAELEKVSDEDFAAIDEAIHDLGQTPASNISERAAMELLGFTEEEIQNEERRTAAKAGEAATREETTGAQPSEAAPALELEAQTAEDLKAKQDEIDRLNKENERLKKEAEAKAKADAEREEFVLTGSDRAADVAAAQGQKDIFGAMEEEPPALAEKPTSNELVTFTHKTDTEPGKGQVSGYYPGTYSYETGADVAIPAKGGKNEFVGSLKESDIYTLKDADQLKREASNAGFEYRQASGNSEIRYLQSLGYKAMRRGPEIIVFNAKDANFKKPEVASEVVPAAEKPAAPQLTREPVTIEGETRLVAEKVQHSMIKDQLKKLHASQVKALETFYGFKSDTTEFLDAVRQDIIDYVNKAAKYINGKIRTIIRSMANGVLSVAVVFNPQFVSQPYTIAIPQYTTKVEQVMAAVPEAAQKDMSEGAKRAYAVIYPAIKAEVTKNDKFFIVADKKSANTFVFNPDGSLFMYSKTLFSAGIGDFLKGDNNIVANRITPAGLFDLGLRDAKRSPDEAATAGEYDFGKVFVLDKSQMGANGPYSTTIMHSVWTHEKDAKQRLAALQKPGAEDSRYSFGCINVDKNTYGQLVTNNLAQMDGAKIFIVPENATDVMSFVNGEATYSKDIIRQRVEPVTKETKVEVERAAPTAETERTVVGKEEEGPVYNDISQRLVATEEKKRSPSFKRRMDKLNRDRLKGKISDEQFVNEADWALKQAENARHEKPVAERVRGADFIRQKLLEAKRKGEISEEAVDLAEWFIRNNEHLVEDLGISIRSPKASGVGGQYSTLSRIIILMKYAGSNLTVVHEILHHLERMMPAKVQQAIRAAWAKQLLSAQKKAKTPAEQLYFKALIDAHYGNNDVGFIDVADGEMSKVFMKALAEMRFENPGANSSMQLAETLLKMGDVPYEQYQFFNPSEFWAVNGSDVVQGRFDAVQGGVLSRLKNWLKELGQKIKGLFGLDSQAAVIKALDSLSKGDGQFVTKDMLGEGEYKNVRRNYEGNEAPAASWESPEESKMDNFIYKLQDKLIDTKRVIENIKKASGEIADNWNAYLKEELFHGRTAKRTQDFLNREMLPILEEMKENGVTLAEFEQYLHMRHAEERNELVAKRNPKMPDQGSGVTTAEAVKYLAELTPEQSKTFASLAKKFDKIIDNTQKLLVSSGLETQDTIDAWNQAYEHYVPLMRDDLDFKHHGTGLGAGYSTKGSTSKSAVGSTKKVIDIFANVALQRERAIVRSEKARVGRALYGLAIKNPNPGFWLPINPEAIKNKEKLTQELIDLGMKPEDAENIIQEPKVPAIDKKTGLVKYQVNPLMRNSDNVFPVRINGEDRYIFFNTSDERAVRMVEALKNLDAEQLGVALGTVAEVTRWIASVNTQFNPVFGAWNFIRDVQGAAFNLTTTDIAGHEKEVLNNVFPAMRGIYTDLRQNRKKSVGKSEWAKLFEQYQNAGGQTGYRDQFNKAKQKANIVQREMSKLDHGNVRKTAEAVFNWLSDYNDAMENAVRLSAFKVALDQGLSEERAASIAKNLTVNFNRKGAASPTLQALYAFFNAAVQGTARLAETLSGPSGRKIMAGGFAIGVFQALALAMAGFDDDDPPEFLKNKNLILPVPGGNYLIIPMPLGFNVFPGAGRLLTEYVLGQAGAITGAKSAFDKIVSLSSLVLDAFNPLGSGSVLQMVAPTVIDPWVSIATNRDAFGRPISKEDRATAPTPGYTRSRENASAFSKALAEFLNYISSPIGTKYTKGVISPTADQIDYLIGQYTGGTGREVMKAAEFVGAVAKGETGELPSYRIPIVGKLYGETESPAAISAKFYENVTKLAEHENEIKMRQKNKDDVQEYKAEHPEVRFIHRVNNLENQITALNKQKKALQEKEAPEERIKRIDERKTKLMKDFNDKVKNLERQ